MEFRGTRKATRNAHSKTEEGSECPLDACGGATAAAAAAGGDNTRAKDYLDKKSVNNRRNSHKTEDPLLGNKKNHRHSVTSPKANAYNHAHGHGNKSSPPPTRNQPVSSQSSPKAVHIPAAMGLSNRECRILRTAREKPPVTRRSLSELDLPCIMTNINLRMDANFDSDLHFKPDLDGEKGKRKRTEAAGFWEAMAIEISIYGFCAAQGVDACGHGRRGDCIGGDDCEQTFQPRLPSMFEALQDILRTLISERDHPSVLQNLEVPLLMQQVHKGVLDMVGLANWLAALLKTHCAPMRDEWADQMVEQISLGSRKQDSQEVVAGLQTLFAILEAMKLDVANHQIRAFRFLLIEDTVPFLQDYFRSKVERGYIRVESSKQWYLDLCEADKDDDSDTQKPDEFWPVAVLLDGLLELLVQFHPPDDFPETFTFNSERLWQLRSKLQNLITLDICWCIFESYIHDKKRDLSAAADTYPTFCSRIWSLMEAMEDCQRGSSQWIRTIRSVSLEIARFVCAACCHDDTMVCDEVIGPIETALEWHLSHEFGLFQVCRESMKERLVDSTFASAKKFLNLSPVAICEAQRLSPFPQCQTAKSSQRESEVDVKRIGTRIAHIAILHWRVWAPMLYVHDELSASVNGRAVDSDDGRYEYLQND